MSYKKPLLFEFSLKLGRITIALFNQGYEKMCLLLGGTEIIKAPLACSGTAKLEIPVSQFLDKMSSEGLKFHTALNYGDYRSLMRTVS